MFLFTTPPETTSSERPATPVVSAIRSGAQRSGTDFSYLLSTAQRESALDPEAKAKTSSATGLFQFIEQTWLGLVKSTGADHGLSSYADAIKEVRPGRFDVPDAATKQAILNLRSDPQLAAVMAGELTRRNGASLSQSIGRTPSAGELYAAHVLGAGGASELIRRTVTTPQVSAASVFPEQAEANRGLFYDRATGKARSISELYATLTAAPQQLAVPNVPQLSSDPATWMVGRPTGATAYARSDGPAMHGLFRTEGVRGPVNATVQRLWSGAPGRSAADAATPRYFPRTAALQAGTASDAATPAVPDATPVPAAVPLPLARPIEFGAASTASQAPDSPAAAPARAARARGTPLDLTQYRRKS